MYLGSWPRTWKGSSLSVVSLRAILSFRTYLNVSTLLFRARVLLTYTALALHGVRSASSLGPSDSASQQARPYSTSDIDTLLERSDAPSVRPEFLPASVLWYYDDCKTDKTYGTIVTASNSCRLKMSIAIHRPDGSRIPKLEFGYVRRDADLIVQKLRTLIESDPRMMRALNSKPLTKTLARTLFKAEYRRAILELEEEHKLLRLCSSHWKADMMIGQAFPRANDADVKMEPHHEQELSQPPTAPIPQASKRALELSPGPKSPSVMRVQKRSKDVHSKQKTTGSMAPPNNREFPFQSSDHWLTLAHRKSTPCSA
jgi:hypothetical protein